MPFAVSAAHPDRAGAAGQPAGAGVEGQRRPDGIGLAVVPDEVRVAVAVEVGGRQDAHVLRLEGEPAEVGVEPGAGVDLKVGEQLAVPQLGGQTVTIGPTVSL